MALSVNAHFAPRLRARDLGQAFESDKQNGTTLVSVGAAEHGELERVSFLFHGSFERAQRACEAFNAIMTEGQDNGETEGSDDS